MSVVVDGRQLKAGRVILGLTVREMAELTGLNRNSVLRVEAHETLPRHAHAADRIKVALESLGIQFSIGGGLANVSFKAAQWRKSRSSQKRAKYGFLFS